MKIGIFSGTFDPVHAGHITFALEAIKEAGLGKVYFLPEQRPRRKTGVTHYAHRMAMLRLALRPYKDLEILDLPDKQFSVNATLPRLKKLFPGSELSMLVGSDMLDVLTSNEVEAQWPNYKQFLKSVNLIAGVRNDSGYDIAKKQMSRLQSDGLVIASKRPHASSRDIRSAVRRGKEHTELLGSLKSYISDNWLYASLDVNS